MTSTASPTTEVLDEKPWSARFGKHLEAARVGALLSRRQLAARLGTEEADIEAWENGTSSPGPDEIARVIVLLALDRASLQSAPSPSPEDLPPLGRRLRHERLGRGITQLEAAGILGVAQATYAGWEIGRSNPRGDHVAALSEFLGMGRVEVEELAVTPFVVCSDRWPALGQLIGGRRQILRMTRPELARELKVSYATVVAWELGHRVPGPHHVRSLAATLQVTVEQIESAIPYHDQLPALGALIRDRQRRLGLRLRDVAARCEVDESTLSRWIHGQNSPGPLSLGRLASVLDVPLAALRQMVAGEGENVGALGLS